MALRKPRPVKDDGFVTVYSKKDGSPYRVPKAVAARIAKPPAGVKASSLFTVNPPKTKETD